MGALSSGGLARHVLGGGHEVRELVADRLLAELKRLERLASWDVKHDGIVLKNAKALETLQDTVVARAEWPRHLTARQ